MTEIQQSEKKQKSEASKPGWVKVKLDEMERIIIDLAREGKSPAQIGLVLRDKHGIPKSVLLGKRITDVLKEKGVPFVSDKESVQRKVERLKVHIGKNKHDYGSSRALTKKLWAIKRMDAIEN